MSDIKNCEYYGYKVGDKFKYRANALNLANAAREKLGFEASEVLTLFNDDRSSMPLFRIGGIFGCERLSYLEPVKSISESQEWNGEGLPPAGIWVLSNGGGKFFYVGLNSIGDHVFEMDNGGITVFDSIEGFRPLPTKRDEWIDKAHKTGCPINIAALLYDAGLAKDIEE